MTLLIHYLVWFNLRGVIILEYNEVLCHRIQYPLPIKKSAILFADFFILKYCRSD